MKKIVFSILTLFTTLLIAEDKIIAFVQDDMSNDFRKAQVIEGKIEASKHKNLKYIYSDAKGQTSI